MADTEKATLGKIKKLMEAWADLQAKQREIVAEIDTLIGGGVGIGQQMKELERAFGDVWEAVYRTKYMWTPTKDRPQLKRLIGTLGVAEVARRMAVYLMNREAFFAQKRHPFGLFVATINQHAGAGQSEALDLEAPTVGGCQHTPVCTSDQEHTRKRNEEMRAF